MKGLTITLMAASISFFAMTNAFANEARIIDATVKVAQGDGGGPCSSGYTVEGTDLNTNAAVTSCAKVASHIDLGPVLAFKIKNLSKAKRNKYKANPLEYFRKQGLLRFSGEDEGEIDFVITGAEIL